MHCGKSFQHFKFHTKITIHGLKLFITYFWHC